MRYWFSELLQKKQRSPRSRLLTVRHRAENCLIHSMYTMLLHRPHPLQGQHPVIHHRIDCRTLNQMVTVKRNYWTAEEIKIPAIRQLENRIAEARQLGMLTR